MRNRRRLIILAAIIIVLFSASAVNFADAYFNPVQISKLSAPAGSSQANDPRWQAQAEKNRVFPVDKTLPPLNESGDSAAVGDSADSTLGMQAVDKVNINTASLDDLMTLSWIGEQRGKDIIAYREQHGKFDEIADIMQVSGIGEGIFGKIEQQICVE